MTATPPDIAAFLLARIAEDKAAARASAEVNPPPWSAEVWQDELTGLVVGGKTKANRYRDGALWDNEGAESLSMEPPTAAHVARHDPARVLADCAAQRAIVDLHRLSVREEPAHFDRCTGEKIGPEYEVTCDVCGWAALDPVSGCTTLRLLAAIWSAHPAFDPAWRV